MQARIRELEAEKSKAENRAADAEFELSQAQNLLSEMPAAASKINARAPFEVAVVNSPPCSVAANHTGKASGECTADDAAENKAFAAARYGGHVTLHWGVALTCFVAVCGLCSILMESRSACLSEIQAAEFEVAAVRAEFDDAQASAVSRAEEQNRSLQVFARVSSY